MKQSFKKKPENYSENGERSTFRWTVYFTDSKLEFYHPFVLKILVSIACVIRTFYLHPLDLIELRLTDEKKYLLST